MYTLGQGGIRVKNYERTRSLLGQLFLLDSLASLILTVVLSFAIIPES